MELLSKIDLENFDVEEAMRFIDAEFDKVNGPQESEQMSKLLNAITDNRGMEMVSNRAMQSILQSVILREDGSTAMRRALQAAFLAGMGWLYLHEKKASDSVLATMATSNLPRA